MRTLSPTESKIRSILKGEGPMTRPQITKASGFAKETVWRVTRDLVLAGILEQIGEAKKGISGALYAATDEQLPADVLSNVIGGWVRGV